MAEFKRLSDVEAVETISDAANVLIEENGDIKKVPKDEIGGGINVAFAEVGQTIVVKSVDENGKPTEWECVDVSSGVGFGFDVVVFDGNNNNAMLSYGSYDGLKSKIDNKQAMLVAIVHTDSEQYHMGLSKYVNDSYEYIGIFNENISTEYQLYPDNTIRVNYIG